MTKDKVTRDALRNMGMGETKVFRLEDALEVYSGRSQANQMQHILKCRFSAVADLDNNTLTITKSPK